MNVLKCSHNIMMLAAIRKVEQTVLQNFKINCQHYVVV